MEEETNVLKIIENILGAGVARHYITMCQPDKIEAFRSLTVDQIRGLKPKTLLNLNGSRIHENFIYFSNVPVSTITIENKKKKDIKPDEEIEDIKDIKDIIIRKGVVVLPSHFFLGDEDETPLKRVGGKIKHRKALTQTAYKITYKLRSYRVFQGKRGGFYIKVKGEWKPIRKDSLAKQQ